MEKVLILNGLNCANCATKIENAIQRIEGVETSTVSLATQKLIIQIEDANEQEKIISEAINIIMGMEEGITITDDLSQNHNTDEQHSEFGRSKKIKVAIGVLVYAIGLIFSFSQWLELSIFLVAYILIGGDVLLKSVKNISKGEIFDENFLMSIATIGAFAIGEFPEGVAVMLFYQIGEFFQDRAVSNSRKSITELMDIRPDFANVKIGEIIKKVAPNTVEVGSIILVRAGEKIPLDGRVIEGYGTLDTSALTGESVPRDVEVGDDVISGTINQNGLLTIEVTKKFGDSTVSKILDLVQNASNKKSPTEKFITKFARYYTPVVVALALFLAILPPLVIPGATFSEWINRALVFLVISCPCALVISIPLGFFGGIGGASKKGILIKGSNYLEALNNVETVVFDKTGTLTKGVFQVVDIKNSDYFSKNDVLKYAAYAENFSNHPIGLSIKKAYAEKIDESSIENYEEIAGHGIQVQVHGKNILAGNKKLMEMYSIPYLETQEIGTKVYLTIDNEFAGCIIISDEIKNDSKNTIIELKKLGVKNTVMLTGDSRIVGESVANELGIDEVFCELLPNEKVEKVEILSAKKSKKGRLVFVGDGINDAPVLAMSDIGVSMGALGSDAAIEAADVVLMTDEPSKLVEAIKIANRTRTIVWQNIIFAMVVKVIVLILGAGGVASMWEAVFADVGVSLIAILNSMRVMNSK